MHPDQDWVSCGGHSSLVPGTVINLARPVGKALFTASDAAVVRVENGRGVIAVNFEGVIIRACKIEVHFGASAYALITQRCGIPGRDDGKGREVSLAVY